MTSRREEMEALRAKFALVSRLTHQNIAKALVLHPVRDIAIANDEVRRELHLSPGDFVIVMDYAPGVTLSKWRRQFPDGVVPPDQALEVVRQIASALDYAHGEKIVHRDIKPANIMVETVGISTTEKTENTEVCGTGSVHSVPSVVPKIRVRILDFGLAAEIRSSMSRISTETGDTSGTRPYMAPEQWLGKKQDGRTDQYALACVAYELLSGAPPFAGAFETGDIGIMVNAVTNTAPEEIEGVPAHVNAALQKALAKNPKERFASCTEFVESCLAQSSQSPQKDFIAEAQRAQRQDGRASLPGEPQSLATSEADVLRRKLALTKAVKAIPAEDRTDKEFAKFVDKVEDELAIAEEACKLGRFAAATESLTAAESALNDLMKAKQAREEAERKAKEEAERKTREEAERKAKEEAERKAKEEAERKAKAERKAIEEKKAQLLKAGIEIKAGERKVVHVGLQGIAFRWCPPGTFKMGSPAFEKGRCGDETQHRVTLTKGFWMGETEVTQEQWKEVMGSNPAYFKSGDNYPVEQVSWDDSQEFLKKLNVHSSQFGLRWTLPTEAQWEYACRAGTTGAYGGTGVLDYMGWYEANSGNKTYPVKQKRPNAWGLYDMHGNVWEWCQELYDNYPSGSVTDPTGPSSGSSRVIRGGSWLDDACYCRSASRGGDDPGNRDAYLGFRVALVPAD